jgi:hypothetical protein
MIPLVMMMYQVRPEHIAKGRLAYHDHLMQNFLFDPAHEPFAVAIEIRTPWRQDDRLHSTSTQYRVESMQKFVSRSWSRFRLPRREPSEGSVNCRAHCIMNASLGCGVTPARCTRRVLSSITNST